MFQLTMRARLGEQTTNWGFAKLSVSISCIESNPSSGEQAPIVLREKLVPAAATQDKLIQSRTRILERSIFRAR